MLNISLVAVLYLEETELSVMEGDGERVTVNLCVALENVFDGLEREITINLTTVPLTAGMYSLSVCHVQIYIQMIKGFLLFLPYNF